MITQELCKKIWICYNEIELTEKLIKECEEAIEKGKPPLPNDTWGCEQNFQMSLPDERNSRRLVKVNPRLALAVLRTHISEQKTELTVLNEEVKLIYMKD